MSSWSWATVKRLITRGVILHCGHKYFKSRYHPDHIPFGAVEQKFDYDLYLRILEAKEAEVSK